MRKKGQAKTRSKLLIRISIAFLIVLIPIYVLGIYIYNWGVYTVENEISNSNMAQVQFSIQQLEHEIERIKTLQYDCLNDENLNNLAIRHPIMSLYEKVQSLHQLQQRLITIQNSSRYVSNVSAHILPIGKTISATNGLDDINMDHYENIRAQAGVKGAQLIEYQGNLYLSTTQNGRPSYRDDLYIIEIELNTEALRESLDQFARYPNSGSFYIFPSTGFIISSASGMAAEPAELLGAYASLAGYGIEKSQVDDIPFFSIYDYSQYLRILLVHYLPQQLVLTPLKSFTVWVWIYTITALTVILLFAMYTYRVVHRPMDTLVKAIRQMETGDLTAVIAGDAKGEFGYLYQHFNEMVSSLRLSIDQAYRQKILRQRAELKQLQSQINPHFLYNSFFIINTMASVGDENLVPFTKHLGEYFRYVTRSDADYVTLGEEVEHARTYTAIQAMRFAKSLTITFDDCPEAFAGKQVPRLIIQPIVENAFEHAVEKMRKNAVVEVRFAVQGRKLQVCVEDNGSEISDEKLLSMQRMLTQESEDFETTGLINIYRRICLIYGNDNGIELSHSRLGGLCVVLTLDFSKETQECTDC